MQYSIDFSDIYTYFVVFARIAPMMIILPVFGDAHIPQQIRMIFSLGLTLIITQVVGEYIPQMNPESPHFFLMLATEMLIGFFLSMIAKIWLMTLQVTANVISAQTSLSNATIFNPAMASSDSIISTAILLGATLLIILTNIHHRFIMVIIESYTYFQPGTPLISEDFSQTYIQVMSQSFSLAIRLSLPFLIVGLVFQVSLGFLNRLMPQLQVFFVALPAQILGGFALIALTSSLILQSFVSSYDNLIFYMRP